MTNDDNTVTYETAVRSFDHSALAGLESYARLREALNDISHAAEGIKLGEFLEAVRDMASTAPYGDSCDCVMDDATYPPVWPHRVDRKDDWLTCAYRCPNCSRTWTCGYAVDVMRWL